MTIRYDFYVTKHHIVSQLPEGKLLEYLAGIILAHDAAARKLASLFNKNFATYAEGASAEVKAAAPVVTDELALQTR